MNTKKEVFQKINACIEKLQMRTNRAQVWGDIFSIMACEISMLCDERHKKERESERFNCIKKYNNDEIEIIKDVIDIIFAVVSSMSDNKEPFNDWLGEIYMNSDTSSDNAGQFFTPYHLSKLMAKVAITTLVEDNHGIITIDEPACGSGGLILGVIEELRDLGINYAENVFVHAADLDGRCVRMCYIQLSLAGVPAVIHQRDTLSMKTFEEWATPAYTFNYLKFRRYGEEYGRQNRTGQQISC